MARKRRSSQFKDSSQVIDIQEARRKRREKRQKQLQKAAAQAKKDDAKPVRASVKARQRKRYLIIAAIILVFIVAIGASVINIVSLKSSQKKALEQQEQLVKEKEALEKQLKQSNDKEFIEEQAREQLRLVDPGEKIYVVPSVGNDEKESSESE